MVMVLFGLLGIGVLLAVFALVRMVQRRSFVGSGSVAGPGGGSRGPHRSSAENVDAGSAVWPVSTDRPVGESGRIRGTMQALHAEEISDVIVLDGYVVLEQASHVPGVLQGPATLALCQPVSTPWAVGAAHLRLQEWIDDGTVLDVEVRHDGSRVQLDVRDETSMMLFDVASAR